ncbi:single-stranded DNA-binding protein (plasmid) [Pontibacillus sp. ALD_SL1]|uniref:single-stranded DNA-binding protein n=1 Tax=Pontibacillus sp. ALD_SL1 TaxID=2777185 RepID=UPI001A96713D|nr:single-stranded DNA-binding protein [Pontibacillus sp. ALD_SL1]QST02935.1 single-stranded DNA-binding protein [Pontibacillus sp. ALD_SL1]
MINRIILEGRLGADPERRETHTGKVVATFPLPLFNPYQKNNASAEWTQCEVWNQPAEFICRNGEKGSLVSVEGRLRNQKYEDKEGRTRYRTYISVDRLTLLNKPKSQPKPAGEEKEMKQRTESVLHKENKTKEPSDDQNMDSLFKDFEKMIQS